MTEVVKFNIGGQRYEVSRSLLQMHPDSMLAKSASDQWHKDPEAEIFIERNGSRFQYVLDYIRDGSVCLPITESREALMKELEYYGIEADGNTIDEKAVHKAKSFQSMRTAMVELQKCFDTLKAVSDRAQIDYRYVQLALDCIRVYLEVMKNPSSNGKKCHQLAGYLNRDEKAQENMNVLRYLLRGNVENARKGANVHLSSVGLHLSEYRFKKQNGGGCHTAVLRETDTAQRSTVQDE